MWHAAIFLLFVHLFFRVGEGGIRTPLHKIMHPPQHYIQHMVLSILNPEMVYSADPPEFDAQKMHLPVFQKKKKCKFCALKKKKSKFCAQKWKFCAQIMLVLKSLYSETALAV